MFCRRWFISAVALAAFLPQVALSQESALTADQIVANYLQAVGADKFPKIKTLIEKAELSGNLTDFREGATHPSQFQTQEQETFEFYFKAPNLRYSLSLDNNNVALDTHGCDGKVSWHIDSGLRRTEFTPKPEREGFCKQGFDPAPIPVTGQDQRLRLSGKKKIGDRMTWEIEVDDPKTPKPETYYFDAETYLLVRQGSLGADEAVTYSDYRDVDGMKVPFTVIHWLINSESIMTLHEVKINLPMEDAWFAEPTPFAKGREENPLRALHPDEIEIPLGPAESPVASSTPGVPDAHIPNFVSCSIAELQETVAELKHLEVAQDQSQLPALLEKIGAMTLEAVRKTPNLISHEAVVSEQGLTKTRQNFSYLVLARAQDSNSLVFDEFRIDRDSGDTFQTDEFEQREGSDPLSPSASLLKLPSSSRALPGGGAAPVTQGFVNEWLYFYPLNQHESQFRYLGQQKMDGHHTLVVAFAQKPQLVRLPVMVRYEDKTFPIFMQGVAWVDASDYRIVRLQTGLLSARPAAPLRELTADIQFAEFRIAELTSPLWLPRAVVVHSSAGRLSIREKHTYSNYRLFRARSKVLLNP